MPLTAILFDIDGTLVDSNEQHISAWEDAFRDAGHRFNRDAIHAQVGKGGDNLVPTLLPGISAGEVKQLGEAEGEAFKKRYRAQVKPFRDAKALIERVRSDGKAVVLASSASREELDYWVELLGVGDLVTATTSRDDVAHSKPCPDIFEAALEKVGSAPEAAIVVGDSPYDLKAAASAGIPSIAVRSGGFTDDVLASHGPLAIYDDVGALLADYAQSPLADA
ncbi:HAD family hydrolase [Sphingomonas piscis]|uniref:HAD family hydrolase n=1 Tax=Sphingomonas piscis TaxID=2714943 RepID=A0A6G7YSM0_9SPHN|nr:HAD family hydrolase [Sphingomonas piscis]QIK79737.1 HAD family hydrolase [Sphingomonas piscis]